jgi:hypothetical protein
VGEEEVDGTISVFENFIPSSSTSRTFSTIPTKHHHHHHHHPQHHREEILSVTTEEQSSQFSDQKLDLQQKTKIHTQQTVNDQLVCAPSTIFNTQRCRLFKLLDLTHLM